MQSVIFFDGSVNKCFQFVSVFSKRNGYMMVVYTIFTEYRCMEQSRLLRYCILVLRYTDVYWQNRSQRDTLLASFWSFSPMDRFSVYVGSFLGINAIHK